MENPWNVRNLDEFLVYSCPECLCFEKSKDNFYLHAIQTHDQARKVFIKLEPSSEQPEKPETVLSDLVEESIEIKEEFDPETILPEPQSEQKSKEPESDEGETWDPFAPPRASYKIPSFRTRRRKGRASAFYRRRQPSYKLPQEPFDEDYEKFTHMTSITSKGQLKCFQCKLCETMVESKPELKTHLESCRKNHGKVQKMNLKMKIMRSLLNLKQSSAMNVRSVKPLMEHICEAHYRKWPPRIPTYRKL